LFFIFFSELYWLFNIVGTMQNEPGFAIATSSFPEVPEALAIVIVEAGYSWYFFVRYQ
jgi:hypothetical protein